MGPVKGEHAGSPGFGPVGSSGCGFFFQLPLKDFLELAWGRGLELGLEPHDGGEKTEKQLESLALEGESAGQGRGGAGVELDLRAQEWDARARDPVLRAAPPLSASSICKKKERTGDTAETQLSSCMSKEA